MATTVEVETYLVGEGVTVLRFVEETPTAETAARAVGCTPAEIAKTVLFLVGGAPVAVVASGDRKVKSGALKRAVERTGKVRLPDASEVVAATGYAPGGVCPFLLPEGVAVVVDESLTRFATIYPAAGDDHSAVVLTAARLLALTGGVMADVTGPLDPEGGA